MSKSKKQMYYSPVGIAAYPWLSKPDIKFDPDGVYQVNLITDKKGAKQLKDLAEPYKPQPGGFDPVKKEFVKDDQGVSKETGKYTTTFKLNAVGKSGKTGDTWSQKPVIFDSNGNRVHGKVNIGAGSTIQVSFEMNPYTQGKGGVSFRMKGVRVYDLVEYQGADSQEWGGEVPEGVEKSFVVNKDEQEWDEDEEDTVEDNNDEEEDEDF
jgi:hypothetical protein